LNLYAHSITSHAFIPHPDKLNNQTVSLPLPSAFSEGRKSWRETSRLLQGQQESPQPS
jgi:hypothetical protein